MTKINLSELPEIIGTMMSDMETLKKQMSEVTAKPESNRTGGIALALEVTGYKRPTIYEKIAEAKAGAPDPIPYTKKAGGKLLQFNEKELLAWINRNPDASRRYEVNQEKKGANSYAK